jgi:hypothetical protein
LKSVALPLLLLTLSAAAAAAAIAAAVKLLSVYLECALSVIKKIKLFALLCGMHATCCFIKLRLFLFLFVKKNLD